MGLRRQCSKTGCRHAAIATLTYVYADSSIVIGPLATYAEPHTYDMCADHAQRLTPPRGWQVVRLAGEYTPQATHSDDLSALADAVSGRGSSVGIDPISAPMPTDWPGPSEDAPRGAPDGSGRRGGGRPMDRGRRHLRVLPEPGTTS